MTFNHSEPQLFNLSLPLTLCFPAWLRLQKVKNMLSTWWYRSPHTHSLTHIWRMAIVLWFVQNHYHATSRMQRSGTCPWQQLTFVKGFFVFCYQGLERFTGMKTEIFPGFLLTTWFLNMTHRSGGLCSERGAGILISVLLMLIYCVLVCLLDPLQKIFCSPSVSRSVCQAKPTMCFCVSLRLFIFE